MQIPEAPAVVLLDFESGVDGAVIPAEGYITNTSGSVVHESDSPLAGTMSMKALTGGVIRCNAGVIPQTHSGSALVRVDAFSEGSPSIIPVQFITTSNAAVAVIRLNPSGVVDIQRPGGSPAIAATSVGSWSVNQDIQLFWQFEVTTGTLTVRIFFDPDSPVYEELVAVLSSTGTTAIDAYGRFAFGSGGGSGTRDVLMDNIMLWDTLVWPEADEPTPGNASYIWANQEATRASVTANVSGTSSVRLAVSMSDDMTLPTLSNVLIPTNGIVRADLTGLIPGTQYYYQFEDLDTPISEIGEFVTMGSNSTYKYAFGSCAATSSSEDAAWASIMNWAPKYLVHLGDFHYSGFNNTTVSNAVKEITDQIMEAGLGAFKDMLTKVPMFYIGSDHDVRDGDNLDNTDPNSLNFHEAWGVVTPHPPLPTPNVKYHAWTEGGDRHIVLDTRSAERSPGLDPQSSSKTMLGADQKAWLFSELMGPGEVKHIYSDVPWVGPASLVQGEDKWWAYDDERTEIATFIETNEINVVMLFGDAHCLQYISAEDNDWGHFPVYGAAPFAQVGGGRYTQYATEFYSTGTEVQGSQYGQIYRESTPEGISVQFVGWDALSNTARLTHTHVFTAPTVQEQFVLVREESSVTPVEVFGVQTNTGPVQTDLLGVWDGESLIQI